MSVKTRTYGNVIRKLGACSIALLVCCSLAQAQTWTGPIQTRFKVGLGVLLLTDGTVLIQENNTANWYILKPKTYTLDYSAGVGTMASTGSLPSGYVPEFYASAMLPGGRVIIEGGEYNIGFGGKVWTNQGAVYDPITGMWSPVNPPGYGTSQVWTKIGDAPSVVLADGGFMLGNIFQKEAAILDGPTLTWTLLTSSGGFKNKCDRNWEEGWTLLPSGKVLTVDAYQNNTCTGTDNSELYDPSSGTWSKGGSTVVQLYTTCGSREIGPALLMPGGNVFAAGASNCGSPPPAGNTAIYDTTTSTWSAGPVFPGGNDMADAPAALLPNGYVLVDTAPGWNKPPSTFYMFDGANWVVPNIPQPKSFPKANTERGRMLILPSGNILVAQAGTADLWFFEPPGTYQSAWQPHICSGCYPAIADIGVKYTVSGTQFNGLSQGTLFGDENQNATNYPVAVITNDATGHKFFARTSDFSTMGVATGSTMVSADFTVLSGTETGDSTLTLITNGIPSNTVGICIETNCHRDHDSTHVQDGS